MEYSSTKLNVYLDDIKGGDKKIIQSASNSIYSNYTKGGSNFNNSKTSLNNTIGHPPLNSSVQNRSLNGLPKFIINDRSMQSLNTVSNNSLINNSTNYHNKMMNLTKLPLPQILDSYYTSVAQMKFMARLNRSDFKETYFLNQDESNYSALCSEIKDDSRLLEKKEVVRDLGKKEKCDFCEIFDFDRIFKKSTKQINEFSSIYRSKQFLGCHKNNEQDYEIRLNRLKNSFQNEEEKDYTKNKFSRKEFEEKENTNNFQTTIKSDNRQEKEDINIREEKQSVNIVYEDENFEQSFEDNLNIAEILEDGEDFYDDHYLDDLKMDLGIDKLSLLTPMNFSPGSIIKEVSIIKEESCLTNDKIQSSHLKEEIYSPKKQEKTELHENFEIFLNENKQDTQKIDNNVKSFIK